MDRELETIERKAYLDSYSDGLVDLFVGLSVVWIGVAWLWVEGLAGLAGVFPAALVPAFVALRKRLVEPRAGYVKWSLRRKGWEKRQVLLLLWLGIGALGLCVAVFLLARDDFEMGSLAAALPAILLGLPALILGSTSGMRRVFIYGGVLVFGGLATAALQADPGVDLLTGGAVMVAAGLALWIRFVRSAPRRHG